MSKIIAFAIFHIMLAVVMFSLFNQAGYSSGLKQGAEIMSRNIQ